MNSEWVPDGWRGVGWTVPQLHDYLMQRDWDSVEQFYRVAVQDSNCLSSLGFSLASTTPGVWSHEGDEGRQECKPQGTVQREHQPSQESTHCSRAVSGAPGLLAHPPPATTPSRHCSTQPHGQQQPRQQDPPSTAAAPLKIAERDRRQQQRARRRQALKGAERRTFMVLISYFGPAFSGWKWQKEQRGAIEEILQESLTAVNHAGEALGQKVMIMAAGRTDKGVHAYRQVISFYTWDEDLTPAAVVAAINAAQPAVLRAWDCKQVPRIFHATFQACWRRYLYLFPLKQSGSRQDAPSSSCSGDVCSDALPAAPAEQPPSQEGQQEPSAGAADLDIDPSRVHALLQPLVGLDLNYTAFARDTPRGKDCVCRLLLARAWACQLPAGPVGRPAPPMLAIELVGTRFLRRMVRVLVSTAVREATPQAAWFPSLAPHPSATALAPAAAAATAQIGATPGPVAATPAAAAASSGAGVALGPAAGAADGGSGSGTGAREWPPLNVGALLEVAASEDRLRSAPPAPAVGLCFLEAGYSAFAGSISS